MSEVMPKVNVTDTVCPRCGEHACLDPDSKECSDNCIRRYRAQLAALEEKRRGDITAIYQMLINRSQPPGPDIERGEAMLCAAQVFAAFPECFP